MPSYAERSTPSPLGRSHPPKSSRPDRTLRLDEVHRWRADERRDEQVRGMAVELLRGVDLLQHPVTEHGHALAEGHRLDLIVRHVHGRGLETFVQQHELTPHLHAELRVEVGQRLVHQERLGFAHHRAAHRDPLALSARELRRPPLQQREEPEDLRGIEHALFELRLRGLPELQPEREVLFDRHVRVEGVALEHHRDVSRLRLQIGDLAVADRDLAGGDLLQSGDHPQDRGLPASGGTHEDHEFAVRDLERDIVDGDHIVAEELGDPIQDDPRHQDSSRRRARGASRRGRGVRRAAVFAANRSCVKLARTLRYAASRASM